MLDGGNVNEAVRVAAGEHAVLGASPIAMAKAVKNGAEIDGMIKIK